MLVGLFLTLIIAGSFLAYWPSYAENFLNDDYKHLESALRLINAPQNLLRVFSPYYDGWYYRPTNYIFFFLSRSLFGLYPPAYYFVQLTIHALNVILVYVLARSVDMGRFAALCAASLFAITVPNQDVFGWISSISVTLAVLFSLGGVSLLLRYLQDGGRNNWLLIASALCIVLAAFSREEALILVPLAGFILWQSEAWRSIKRSELFVGGFILLFATAFIYFNLTRPTWTDRGDVLANLASLRLLSPTEPAAYLLTVASKYLFFDPAVVLQYSWLSLFFLFLVITAAIIITWQGSAAARLGIVWWALGALFLYIFIWSDIGIAGRYLYMPWIGVALVFAALVNRINFSRPRLLPQVAFSLILGAFLLLQAAYARAAQAPWQAYVDETADIESQTRDLLPELDQTNHLYAHRVPPVPDYIAAMASVWYDTPRSIQGGYLGRLLRYGQATDKFYALDVEDGRLYNLMPELQEAAQTYIIWDEEPLAEVVRPDGSRRALETGSYELDVVSGPAGERRFGFFLHPPAPQEGYSSLTYEARIPEESALTFGVRKEWGGIDDEDGARVRVVLTSPSAGERILYEEDLDAAVDSWTEVTVPMDEFGGQDVQLSFQTAAGNNFLHDHLYWANPRLVTGETAG